MEKNHRISVSFLNRFYDFCIRFPHFGKGQFVDFTVIGHQSINFSLHIGGLGLNSTRKTTFDHSLQQFGILQIFIRGFF